MPKPIRIRARVIDDLTEVMVLMPHPMETGLRRDAAGRPIPADYIAAVTVEHGQRTVFAAELGPGVSHDPLLAFRFRGGRAGEQISVTWTDTGGGQRTDTAVIG